MKSAWWKWSRHSLDRSAPRGGRYGPLDCSATVDVDVVAKRAMTSWMLLPPANAGGAAGAQEAPTGELCKPAGLAEEPGTPAAPPVLAGETPATLPVLAAEAPAAPVGEPAATPVERCMERSDQERARGGSTASGAVEEGPETAACGCAEAAAARGCAETPGGVPVGKRACTGRMGTGTRLDSSTRNSKSVELGGTDCREKGNEVSSKTTCRDMITRLD
ncbi:hypothetical protein PVAP13_5KG228507 [Panicum virgatum]|uniref:Uncharacterized protein n=1 Tax=Panicum virgatum TaxID=38727 RepID=A0A8T0SH28_PANVG|nr:hypothetical protein PVAP13_5KG228507 [Panicum virgatum]